MKYLKLYEQFRLIKESTEWKKNIEIDGTEFTIKWGMPKLELGEIFQTLNHHKSSLPKKWSDSFGVIFDSPSPGEFQHQTDPDKIFINKSLEPSMMGKATPTNPEIKYSCFDLLQLESIGGKSGEDLVPYHNFIKEIHKSFWGGDDVQLSEEQLLQLAENKKGEAGDGDSGFHKALEEKEFVNKKKIYYDIYVITDKNPDGVVPDSEITKAGWISKLRGGETPFEMSPDGLLPNMKEPSNPEHKKLWLELREHDKDPKKSTNPEWKDKDGKPKDSAQIIWQMLIDYKAYFGGTFDYTTQSIKKGSEISLPAAVNMGELYLTGGNRRMTYFCLRDVLPTIWIWQPILSME